MPVACQSRGVTEPQREKARLEWDLPCRIYARSEATFFTAYAAKNTGHKGLVAGEKEGK